MHVYTPRTQQSQIRTHNVHGLVILLVLLPRRLWPRLLCSVWKYSFGTVTGGVLKCSHEIRIPVPVLSYLTHQHDPVGRRQRHV